MHIDSVLEVSENTLIPKSLMASKNPRYRFFVFFLKPRFRFLTVTEKSLVNIATCTRDSLSNGCRLPAAMAATAAVGRI